MSPRPSRKHRRQRAIAATSAVLGVTAALTLAGWTVTSYLAGAVTTGNITGIEIRNTSTGTWTSVSAATSANALSLTFPTSDPYLVGGDAVYSEFEVRTKAGTQLPIPLTITQTTTGVTTGLSYELFTVATPACTSSSVPVVSLAASGTSFSANPTGSVTLAAATSGAAGPETYFCLKVSALADSPAIVEPTTVWTFTGGW